jgi:hypothetical protein
LQVDRESKKSISKGKVTVPTTRFRTEVNKTNQNINESDEFQSKNEENKKKDFDLKLKREVKAIESILTKKY